MQRSMTLLVALAMVLVGCTTGTSDPSPTPAPSTSSTTPDATSTSPPPGRVAVVVSPDPSLAAAAAEIGTRSLASGLLDGTELRVVTADDPSFLADLTTFFATEGYDLVCAIGAGAERAVREVAATSPSTRFCAAPARARGMPDNVLPIDVRVQELGYVAGVALAADGLSGSAGLVTSPVTWAPGRLEAGLAAGLAAGGVAAPSVQAVAVTAADGAGAEVAGLLQAGVGGFLSLAGEFDAAVRDTLVEVPVTPPAPASPGPTDAASDPAASPTPSPTEVGERLAGLVAGPEARPEEGGAELADLVLVLLELHLEEAVSLAVGRHVDGWDTAPASVGLADGAFRVDAGSSARAGAVATAVEDAVAGIRAGEIEVPSG